MVEKAAYEGLDGNIFTLNTIEVFAWLKGHSQEAKFGLLTWGGFLEVEKKGQITEPSLQLDGGSNEYIFFLEPDNLVLDNKEMRRLNPEFRQCFATTDVQGAIVGQFGKYHDLHYPTARTEAEIFQLISSLTGLPVLRPNGKPFEPRPFAQAPQAENVTGFSPAITNGGTVVAGEFVTITGSGFGASIGTNGNVYFKNVNDGGASEVGHSNSVSDYTNWSDNSITVKVPQNGGSGPIRVHSNDGVDHISSSSLTVNYGHTAVYSNYLNFSNITRQRYYFRNLWPNVGYIFLYNNTLPTASDAMSNTPDAKAAFERALTTWRCNSGWNAVVSGSSTTSAGLASDGISSVMFVSTLPGNANAVGRATSRFSGNGANMTCDMENTVWWLKEVDVEFELLPNGGNWNFTGNTNPCFESVAAHELGHGHGLQHVMPTDQLMSWITTAPTAPLYPNTNELAGANARMTYSTVGFGCSSLAAGNIMSAVPTGVCSAAVLPVELLRFYCESRENLVRLQWSTATELNNDVFEIERSTNGENFSKIGEIKGQGNSIQVIDYLFDDQSPASGVNYYRLNQVDFDGKTTYSAIETAYFRGEADLLTISPNPANEQIFIDADFDTVLKVFNSFGALVALHIHIQGRSQMELSNLTNGVYFLMDEISGTQRKIVVSR